MISRTAAQLLALLDAGHRLTKRQAAGMLHRDPRTVTRLVAELRQHGVSVREDRDPQQPRAKRYFLGDEDQRRGLRLEYLDERALLALTVAAQAAQAALTGTPLEAPLQRAFGVLLGAVAGLDDVGELTSFEPETEAARWHFGSLRTEPPDPDVFATLRRAIQDQQRIRMDYVTGKGKRHFGREVDPLALAPIKGTWLLAAYCHLRHGIRDFALARVSNVRPLRRYFTHADGFDVHAHFSHRFGALEGSSPVEVRLRVSSERAVYFRSRRYHSSQTISEEHDGSLEITYHMPGGDALDEVRAFVASWGPHVEVLAPDALADRIAEDAAEVARLYQVAP